MAISVTSIGTNSTAVANTSLAITVPAGGVPSGALIAAFIHTQSTSGAPSATDSASNTYTVVGQQADNNSSANGYSAMLYAKNVTALTSGNTITISYASASQKQISAIYATGIDTTAPLDTSVTAVAFGSSTSPSVTSGAPSVSGELFVAWNGINNAFGSTVTNDTANGWTAPFSGFGNGGTRHYIGYQVNSGSSAKTYAPVWNNTGAWSVGVAGFKAASTGYSLTAANGSFTLSGQNASLEYGHKLTAAVGSFAISGQATALKRSAKVTAARGTFSLTGQAALFARGKRVVVDYGAFAITGQAATFRKISRLTAAVGTISLSGQAALLERGLKVTAAFGSYSLTGRSASLTRGQRVAAAVGSFSLTGQGVGLRRTGRFVAAVGSYSLSGQAALLKRALKVVAARGTFTLTGFNANLFAAISVSMPAAFGSFTVTGSAVTLARTLAPIKRDISASSRRELERQESAEAFPVFLTITHESLADPIRVVADPKDFMLNGQLFTGFLFESTLLTDADRYPEARITLQNVDRKIGDAVRNLVNPPRVKIEVYPLSEFNTSVVPRVPLGTPTAEYSADRLFLTDITVDAFQIEGRLTSWNYAQEVWPGPRATQLRFPGLFR